MASGFWALSSAVLSLAGCTPVTTECDPSYGECPPPAPGLYVDDLSISKSVWYQDPSPDATLYKVCTADLRSSPESEVLFYSESHLVILQHANGQITQTRRLPVRGRGGVEFYDFDGDGNAEYVQSAYQSGATDFRASYGTLIFTYPDEYIDWQVFNLGNDAEPDFAVFHGSVVSIWSGSGQQLFSVPYVYGHRVVVANLDADDDDEILLGGYNAFELQYEITAWDGDGTLRAIWAATEEVTRSFSVAALQDDLTRHYLAIAGNLYDLKGTLVSDDSHEWLEVINGVTCLSDDYDEPCRRFQFSESPDEIRPDCPVSPYGNSVSVQFDPNISPYTVNVQNSVFVTQRGVSYFGLFGGSRTADTQRAIVKISDASGNLVFHEVLNAGNYPGAFAVISGTVPGTQGLLVADDNQLLIYELRE